MLLESKRAQLLIAVNYYFNYVLIRYLECDVT